MIFILNKFMSVSKEYVWAFCADPTGFIDDVKFYELKL